MQKLEIIHIQAKKTAYTIIIIIFFFRERTTSFVLHVFVNNNSLKSQHKLLKTN